MNHLTNRVSVCRGCQQNTFKLPNETSCKHWTCHYLSIAGHKPFSYNGSQYKPVVFEYNRLSEKIQVVWICTLIKTTMKITDYPACGAGSELDAS